MIMKFSEINSNQIYFRLKDISGLENFLSKIRGGHKIANKKKNVERFFQFLMLNISLIKERLHKPPEIQWIITTVPGKLKRKIPWALSYKILPPLKSQNRIWYSHTLQCEFKESNVQWVKKLGNHTRTIFLFYIWNFK